MEKAILVGVTFGRTDRERIGYRLSELENLARTAGAESLEKIIQNRSTPDSRYFLGKGLLEQLGEKVKHHSADIVVFWNDLSPTQERNIEDALGIKIVNRTELILDIFAQHARTREGALQVEMAQTTYLLTRLVGRGVQMSRLGGGIGTRGPGETKLEMDRRRLRQRLTELKQELLRVQKERDTQRELRRTAGVPLVAIVGYTNAGKSSLMKALTHADVIIQDQLFATLDPTVRRRRLPRGSEILLIDTVGFVENLPQALLSAFQATLQEVKEADLLLHIIDASDPDAARKIESVEEILLSIGISGRATIAVFNKIDLIEKPVSPRQLRQFRPAVAISAQRGDGIDALLEKISEWARKRMRKVRLRVPFADAHLFSVIYRFGELLRQDVKKEMYELEVRIPPELVRTLVKYQWRKRIAHTANRK